MGSKQSVLKSNSLKKSGKLKSKAFKRYLRSSILKALKVAPPIKLVEQKEEAGPSRLEANEEPKRIASKISETTNNFESKKHELLENILRIEPKRTDDKIEFLTPDDFGLFSPAFSSKKSSLENFDSYWSKASSSEEYSSQDSESIDESAESYDDFDYYGNQRYYYDPKENLNVAYVQGTVYRREIYGPPKEDRTEEVPIGREEYVITRRFEFGDKTKSTMPKKTTIQKPSVSPGSSKGTRSTRSSTSISSSRGTSSSSVSTVSSKKSPRKKVSGKSSVKKQKKKTAKPGPSRQKGTKKTLSVKKGRKTKKPSSGKKKPVKKNKSNLSLRSTKSKTPNRESPPEIETPYFCQPPFFPYFPDQRPCVCPQHGPLYESQVERVKLGSSGKDVRIGVGQGNRPGYDIEFNDSGNMNLKIEQLVPGNNKTFIYRSGNAGSDTSLKRSESSKKLKKSKVSIKEGLEEKPKSALKLQKSQTSVKSKKKKVRKKKSKTKLGAKVAVKKTPSKTEKGRPKNTKPESIKAVKKSVPKTGKTPWEKKAKHLKKPIVERCELDETELRNAILKPENKELLKKLCQGFDDKVDKTENSKQSDMKQIELKPDSDALVKGESKTAVPSMNIVINVPPCGKVENIPINPFEKRDTIGSVRSDGSKEIYFDVGLKNMGTEYMQNVAQKASMSYNHPDAKIKVSTPSIATSRRTLPGGTRNSEAIQTNIAMEDLKDTPDHILKNSVEPKLSSEDGTGIKSAIKSPVGSAGNASQNSMELKDIRKTDEDDSKKRKVKLTDQDHDIKSTSRVNFDEDVVDLKDESKQLLDIKENLAYLRKELEEGMKDKKGKGTNRVIAIYTRRKPSGQDIFEECLSACEDGTIDLGERKRERSKSRKHRRKTENEECQDKKLPSFKSDAAIPKTRFENKNEEFDSEEEITSDDYYEKLKEQLRSELEASQPEKKDPTSKRFLIQEDDSPEEKKRKHKEMLEAEMKKGGFIHPSNKKASSASELRDELKFESRNKSDRTSNIKPTDVTQLFLKSLEELQEAWHHPDNVTSAYNIGQAEDENQIIHRRDPSMASRNQKRRMFQRKLASRTSIWQHPESSIVEESPISSVDSEEQFDGKPARKRTKNSNSSDGYSNPQSRTNSSTRQGSTDSPSQKIQIQRDAEGLGPKIPRDRGSSGGLSSPKDLRSPRGTQRKVRDRLSNDTTIGKRNPDDTDVSEEFAQKVHNPASSDGQSSPKDLRSPRGTQRKVQDRLSNDTTIGKRNPDDTDVSEEFGQKASRENRTSSGGQSSPKDLRSPRGTQRRVQDRINDTTMGKKNPEDISEEFGQKAPRDRVSSGEQSSPKDLRSPRGTQRKVQDRASSDNIIGKKDDKNSPAGSSSSKTPTKEDPHEQYQMIRSHSAEESGQEIIARPTVLPIQTNLAEKPPNYEPKEAKITVGQNPNQATPSERLSPALKTSMKSSNATDSKQGSYQRHTKFANGPESRKSNLNDLIRATGKVHLKELKEGTLKVDVSTLNSKGFEGQVPDDGKRPSKSAFDMKTMQADMEECKKTYNITEDEIKMMTEEKKMPESQGAQCLAFCMTEKLGVVNDKGEMDKTAMAAFSKEVMDEKDHPKIDTVVDACDEEVKEKYKNDDDFSKCSNTLVVVGCILKQSEKVGLQHPFAGKN